MTPLEKGKMNEKLVVDALEELERQKNSFVHRVRQSSPAVDGRGIDILAEIRLPRGLSRSIMTVPIEVKSSPWGVDRWKVVHSDLHRAGVLVFYVRDTTPRKLRRLIYRALERVRMNSNDGTLYHSMFQRLFKGGSRNLRKNIELIRRNRMKSKKPRRPHE